MALPKLPAVRTPLNPKGVWLVPVSKVLRLGCVLTACRNPSCPCTELVISAYSLDERVQGFGLEKGQLVVSQVTLDDRPSASPSAPQLASATPVVRSAEHDASGKGVVRAWVSPSRKRRHTKR